MNALLDGAEVVVVVTKVARDPDPWSGRCPVSMPSPLHWGRPRTSLREIHGRFHFAGT